MVFHSHLRGASAMTSSSQKFMKSVLGNWTMTYLKGGILYGQYRETVAPAGTAAGYWPHSVYCHNVGVETRGLTFVKPTMKLSDLFAKLSVYTSKYRHYELATILCIHRAQKKRLRNILGTTLTKLDSVVIFT